MARKTTPITDKHIKEYEKKIKTAISSKDKQKIKEAKRLFIVFIKRRGKEIDDFKENKIYKYYINREKPKRKEILKREIQELKEDKLKKEIIEILGEEETNLVNAYFSNSLNNLNFNKYDLKKIVEIIEEAIDIITEENDNEYQIPKQKGYRDIIKLKENELKRLENKKFQSKQYREKIKILRKHKNKKPANN